MEYELQNSQLNLSFHIDFNGQCKEAFEYYAEHLNGKPGTMLAFRDSPVANSVPEYWLDKIVHANISFGNVELAGADVQPEQYQAPKGFYVLLGLNSEDKVISVFNALSAGGEIILSPQKTFWSPCYSITIDRFGVPWKINFSI